ncbi:MAG: glycosyltransferase family 9 protein [Chitinophagales bacterium]
MERKFLIIRFSSIGDIVFTTPVIRCLRKQYPDAEIHFLTKPENKIIIEGNPYLNKILLLQESLFKTISMLREEKYDAVIDLHHNLRTCIIKALLLKPCYSVEKLNWEKFLMVNFHYDTLPKNLHVFERNLATVAPLGVKNDGEGMDYFIAQKHEVAVENYGLHAGNYIAWVVGAKHFTKILPIEKVQDTIALFQQHFPDKQIVLLGGKEDVDFGGEVHRTFSKNVHNFCGKFNLSQSVSILSKSTLVIAGDTGLLHIAVALGKPVVSLWGSTIPEFGVFPRYGKSKAQPHAIIEINNLACRPCTKFGKSACPQKHFMCMKSIDAMQIVNAIHDILKQG